MRIPLLPAAITLASLAMTGCLWDGASNDPSDPGAFSPKPEEVVRRTAYHASGTRLILQNVSGTSPYCEGDELKYAPITGDDDTLDIKLDGNGMRLYESPAYAPGSDDARVRDYSMLKRIGSGSGYTGTWELVEQGYEVISGDLTAAERSVLEEDLALVAQKAAFRKTTLTFTEDSVFMRRDVRTAAWYIDDWNEGGESSNAVHYDIAVKEIDPYTVELKGRVSGETVRCKILPNGDRTYTSDRPEHPEHRYFNVPTACPNEGEPSWFIAFLGGNLKLSP